MLNYIWAGLIFFSLVFALSKDIGDIRRDTYRNGAALPVTIVYDGAEDPQTHTRPVHVLIDPQAYRTFYRNNETPAPTYPATLTTLKSRFGYCDNCAKDAVLALIRKRYS